MYVQEVGFGRRGTLGTRLRYWFSSGTKKTVRNNAVCIKQVSKSGLNVNIIFKILTVTNVVLSQNIVIPHKS